MPVFWTVWACAVIGILLLASVIEVNGARNGFLGANGIFLFASGYLTVLSSPVLFVATWIWTDFLTAVIVWVAGAVIYAALFAATLRLLDRLTRKPS